MSRREFLKGATATLGAFALPSAWPKLGRAATADPLMVVVYLRGGADGLNLVVPAGDPSYYGLRPNIQVPSGDEIPLDGFFGLNAALGSLLPLYDDGDLAIVHAAGSPHETRSHFDAQDFMERAAPGDAAVVDGWLNRYVGQLATGRSWTGLSIGPAQSLALSGSAPTLSFNSIADFALVDPTDRRASLAAMYGATDSLPLRAAGTSAFDALDTISSVDTASSVLYAPGPLGAALLDAAALLRADVGVRLINIDVGGWDHHEGEDEAMPPLAGQLGSGLASFRDDLGPVWDRTCVLVMTEFGRTALENGSRGTDHGHGSVMLAAGGGVVGGRVLLANDAWPGLGPTQLWQGRDLAVTTDFRDVFAEVLHRHMGAPLASLMPVLPGHSVSTATMAGIFG